MKNEIFIHPTAEVHNTAVLGHGTTVWNQAQIREDVTIGERCVLSKDTYIDRNVTIGSGVKIQNGVSVYQGVTVEDNVFIGPHVCFTNDKVPRAFNEGWEITPTKIKKGASIGANATIVCGIEIGEYAMVAAGAVVTKSVPPYGLVMGNPAILKGYVDKLGYKVNDVLPGGQS